MVKSTSSPLMEWKMVQVGATPDLMVAYIDFFLGGDEKRVDIVSIIQKRFPMYIIFGGDGSYMSPYNIHSDTLLTNLLGQVSFLSTMLLSEFVNHITISSRIVMPFCVQHVPGTVWNRLVAGLNARLRTARHGSIRSHLIPVINWINSHANPQLEFHGVKIELGWFQATASGYYQLGMWVIVGDYPLQAVHQSEVLESSNESQR